MYNTRVTQTASGTLLSRTGVQLCSVMTWGWGEEGCGVGARLQREGTYVYMYLIHAAVEQKRIHCKAIIFQLK